MFVKYSKSKNYEYAQIVKSYRQGKKTKHKIIANLGRTDNIDKDELKQIIECLNNLIGENQYHEDNKLPLVEEIERVSYADIVYKKLWKKFDINGLCKAISEKTKITFPINEALYLMVIDRLLQPKSKLASFKSQDRHLKPDDVKLQDLYKTLDILAEHKDEVEQKLFEQNMSLFNLSVDVVLYDVTTYHFESQKSDKLRNYGFSKAGKFNEVQVVMGLLVDTEGRPVGYNLFEGNIYEGKTLIPMLEKIKERFNIGKLIIICDRGMGSNLNLKEIDACGYKYIVGFKSKSASKKLQDLILEPDEYIQSDFKQKSNLKVNSNDKKQSFKYKILSRHQSRFKNINGKYETMEDDLICTYSSKRAIKDKKDRERMIEKSKTLLTAGQSVKNKKGAYRYLLSNGDGTACGIDINKVEEDERWDGYYVIRTNCDDLDVNDLLEYYNSLWRVEESFKVMKSTMKLRPIFHWTPKRIKGHFVMCFIAFLLERTLEYRLRKNDISISQNNLVISLNSLEFSRITVNNVEYYLRSKHDSTAGKILKIFKIGVISNLSTPIDVYNYYNSN